MISLERNHLELEIIGKKVLLSVTLGEPAIQGTYKISCECFFCYCLHIHTLFILLRLASPS
jgi:hypothetical protein